MGRAAGFHRVLDLRGAHCAGVGQILFQTPNRLNDRVEMFLKLINLLVGSEEEMFISCCFVFGA
jgi:hypothetical protein